MWEVALRLRQERPIVVHGTGLGIANLEPPSEDYLQHLERIIERLEPAWVSDHLCWCAHRGVHSLDLLPFPLDMDSLALVVRKVHRVQERLRRPIALENISRYLGYRGSVLTECQFLQEVAKKTGCGVLLDVNNLVVNARNLNEDIDDAIGALPAEAVIQYHIAGHTPEEGFWLDTHIGPTAPAVWRCYESALDRIGARPTLIEWDFDLPEYAVLEAESQRARAIERERLGEAPRPHVSLRPKTPEPTPAQPRPHEAIYEAMLKTKVAMQDADAAYDALPPKQQALLRGALWAAGELDPAALTHRYGAGFFMLAIDNLWSGYPLLCTRLSEPKMVDLIRAYLKDQPPSDPREEVLSAHLPEFLERSFAPGTELPELARFERTLRQLMQAPDEAQGDWLPNARLLQLAYPVHMLEKGDEPLAPEPTRLLMFRDPETIHALELPRALWPDLEALEITQDGLRLLSHPGRDAVQKALIVLGALRHPQL